MLPFEDEVWKNIKGYKGCYQVSNYGRVKSLARKDSLNRDIKERIFKPSVNNRGYSLVVFCKNGKIKTFTVHRLVAKAFIPNPLNKPSVNHINGIKQINRPSNLEWCTTSENNYHAYKLGLKEAKKGETHFNHKLTKADVVRIRVSSLKLKDLAKMFNVSFQLISAIRNNKAWRHV
jgi:hypothetical protein